MTREPDGVPHPRPAEGDGDGPATMADPPSRRRSRPHSWVADWVQLGRRFADMEAAPERAEQDEEAVLRALAVVRSTRARLDDLERRLIVAARDRHVTWRRIATALGVCTPQAAQQRFLRVSRPEGHMDPDTSGPASDLRDGRASTTNGGQRG